MDMEKTSVRRLKLDKTSHQGILNHLKDGEDNLSLVGKDVIHSDEGGVLADLLKKLPALTDLTLRLKIEDLLDILKNNKDLAGAIKGLETLETLK